MRGLCGLVLILTFGVASSSAEGCGDKFLRVGRGARFQRGYVALHPACIVLYAKPRSALAKALRELAPALQKAGHKPLLVEDPGGIAAALRTGHYNLVMADLDDVNVVQEQASVLATPPSILPVVSTRAAETTERAKREFGCFVTAPGKKSDVLAEIDGVLERRLRKDGAAAQSPARPPNPKK
jgi:hypothetical protein